MGRSKVNRYSLGSVKFTQEEKINHMLELLELHALPSALDQVCKTLITQGGSYYDFLEAILEVEILSREEARLQRWMKAARFPAIKTIESFDFQAQPTINEKQIKELASCRFIAQGQNIILFGPPGVGKTHIASAIGREAIHKGIETRFMTLDRLIELVRKQDEAGLRRLLRTLTNLPLLIIDDIDYEEPGKNVSLFLHKLIARRHETAVSTIVTSNKNFSEWAPLFSGDKNKASSAIDRLCSNGSPIININGKSYRISQRPFATTS